MHIAPMDEISTASPPRKRARPRLFKRGHSQLVWDKTNGRCWYCGQTLVAATDGDSPDKDYGPKSRWFTIDHIEPRASRLRACSRLPPLYVRVSSIIRFRPVKAVIPLSMTIICGGRGGLSEGLELLKAGASQICESRSDVRRAVRLYALGRAASRTAALGRQHFRGKSPTENVSRDTVASSSGAPDQQS
jgi:hypothetical protein